ATPLNQREFEQKITAYPARLEELADEDILARVPPARLELFKLGQPGEIGAGALLIIDVLSDRDGSWDVRKSFELEKRVAALELFARLPGARVSPADAAPTVRDLQPVAPAP